MPLAADDGEGDLQILGEKEKKFSFSSCNVRVFVL